MKEKIGPHPVQEELPLAAAAGGDETALAMVIAKLLPAVRFYAGRASCPGLDFDDAMQEGLIGVLSAIKTYRQGKGANFYTYASLCARRAVASARRKALAKKQAPLAAYLQYDAQITTGQDPVEITIQRENVQTVLDDINALLSPLEKQVLTRSLAGLSYQEIAAALSLPQKAVDNATQRIRKKLKA